MFIVDHHVKPSPIHGLGVFLLQPVKAGAIVWRYEPMFDVELTTAEVNRLPQEEAETVFNHAEYFPERGVFRLGNDADIFMNHSSRPALLDKGDVMVAARDLILGDELTCDYSEVHVVSYWSQIAYRSAAE